MLQHAVLLVWLHDSSWACITGLSCQALVRGGPCKNNPEYRLDRCHAAIQAALHPSLMVALLYCLMSPCKHLLALPPPPPSPSHKHTHTRYGAHYHALAVMVTRGPDPDLSSSIMHAFRGGTQKLVVS